MDLKKLKGLLGIPESDTTQDAALQFLMEDVDETIQNYCNLKAVPAGLTSTSYRMAMDLYRYERPGDGDAPARVSSISEGDTSTSFANAPDALSGGILKDYQGQLNLYRKLGW